MSTTAPRAIDVSEAARRQGSPVARLVALCVSHPLIVLAAAILLCVVRARYAVEHFALTTDTDVLLSHSIPWRKRQNATRLARTTCSAPRRVPVDREILPVKAPKIMRIIGDRVPTESDDEPFLLLR